MAKTLDDVTNSLTTVYLRGWCFLAIGWRLVGILDMKEVVPCSYKGGKKYF